MKYGKNKEEQILKIAYIQASQDPIREKLIEEWDSLKLKTEE